MRKGPRPTTLLNLLRSFLINHLASSLSVETRLLYHYFDFRVERDSHQAVMVVRHLLRQLLQQEDLLPQEVLTLYDASTNSRNALTDRVWMNTFFACMLSASKHYIVLDGLDECADQRGLGTFLRRLRQSKTKIYLTGRASSHKSLDLLVDHKILIKAPQSDLVIYIKSFLEEDKDLSSLLTNSLNNDVVLQLADHADGTFLLAKLALDNLGHITTVRSVRDFLLRLPQNLRSAHQTTFERIQAAPAAKRNLALKALAWTLFVKRPLKIMELLHALALEQNDSEIGIENIDSPSTVIRVCLGFLEHREDTDLVQFSHATVMQYLESECDHIFEGSSLAIARSCVRYLAQLTSGLQPCQSSEELAARFSNYPFFSYAALYWGEHAFTFQAVLATDIQTLLRSQNSMSSAAQAFHYLRRARSRVFEVNILELPQDFGRTHLPALWGLCDIAILESPSHDEIVASDSCGWQPLHWAAARGHPKMIEFLLLRGANIETKDHQGWTPLFWAVFWSRLNAVRYLLDKGANLRAKDNLGNSLLNFAADRNDSAVHRELLDRNAGWNAESPHEDSVDEYESQSETTMSGTANETFTLEETQKRTVKQPEVVGETALERAAMCYPVQSSEFEAILTTEAKAARSSKWHRPLFARMEQYLTKLKKKDPYRLTDIGSDIPYSWFTTDLINQESYEAAVLGYAILTENFDMVKALINVGVDLKVDWSRQYRRIEYFQFPVLLAAFVGNTDIITLLIEHGAKLDVTDYEGRNPLHYVAILGHVDAAHLLCSYKAPNQITDKEGRSPLHVLWLELFRSHSEKIPQPRIERSLDIAEILVRSGLDINLTDGYGSTALHAAVQTKRLEVVQKLIQLGADVNLRAMRRQEQRIRRTGSIGHTSFTMAFELHEWDIASALHEAGAVLPEGMNFRSPLIRIIADGDLPALQILFSLMPAAQIIGKNTDQGIPLIILAIRSLQYIMDGPKQRTTDFRKPFELPKNDDAKDAPERYRAVIEFMLERGEDPNAEDPHGSTALLEALEYGYSKGIVDLLLIRGADIKAVSKEGLNALQIAAMSGFTPFVELVLAHSVGVDKISGNGTTPLSLAAANGHEEIVELLLKQPNIRASADEMQKWLQLSRFYNYIRSYDLPQLRDLMTTSLPVYFSDRKGRTLLHLAAEFGISEAVSGLLALGADVNAQDVRGDTALHAAAKSQNSTLATINALNSGGADIQAKNFAGDTYGINRVPCDATALHMAAYFGRVEVVRAILDHASKLFYRRTPSKSLTTLRGFVSSDDRCRFIDWASDRCGRTALMCAVQSGDVPTVKCLLEMGASVNASGGRGSWAFNALDLTPGVWRVTGRTMWRVEETEAGAKSEMILLLESYGAEVFEW